MAVVNGIRIALEREPVLNCPKIAVVQVALVPAASGPALAASCESLVSLALPHATITAAGALDQSRTLGAGLARGYATAMCNLGTTAAPRASHQGTRRSSSISDIGPPTK